MTLSIMSDSQKPETNVGLDLNVPAPDEAALDAALAQHVKEHGVPEDKVPSELRPLVAEEEKPEEVELGARHIKPDDSQSDVAVAPKAEGAEKPSAREEPAPPKEGEEKPEGAGSSSEDPYKDIALPPSAKGASAAAFAALKERAARDLAERDEALRKAQERIEELEKKVQEGVVPKEQYETLLTENEALKEWRAKLDVEADPKWAEYDKKMAQAEEFVYAQLKQHGFGEEVIEKIKELGGPTKVEFGPIFERLKSPSASRLIQKKLDEIEEAETEKQAAIEGAKSRIKEYVEARRKEFVEALDGHNKATEKAVGELLAKQAYLTKYDLKGASSEEERKNFEEHNKWVDEVGQVVKEALEDTSPQMRALLIAGVAQYMHLRREYQKLVREHSDIEKQVDALKKELAERDGKLKKIKEASVSSLSRSAAPRRPELPESTLGNIFTKTAEQAFDEYLKNANAERG